MHSFSEIEELAIEEEFKWFEWLELEENEVYFYQSDSNTIVYKSDKKNDVSPSRS